MTILCLRGKSRVYIDPAESTRCPLRFPSSRRFGGRPIDRCRCVHRASKARRARAPPGNLRAPNSQPSKKGEPDSEHERCFGGVDAGNRPSSLHFRGGVSPGGPSSHLCRDNLRVSGLTHHFSICSETSSKLAQVLPDSWKKDIPKHTQSPPQPTHENYKGTASNHLV